MPCCPSPDAPANRPQRPTPSPSDPMCPPAAVPCKLCCPAAPHPAACGSGRASPENRPGQPPRSGRRSEPGPAAATVPTPIPLCFWTTPAQFNAWVATAQRNLGSRLGFWSGLEPNQMEDRSSSAVQLAGETSCGPQAQIELHWICCGDPSTWDPHPLSAHCTACPRHLQQPAGHSAASRHEACTAAAACRPPPPRRRSRSRCH